MVLLIQSPTWTVPIHLWRGVLPRGQKANREKMNKGRGKELRREGEREGAMKDHQRKATNGLIVYSSTLFLFFPVLLRYNGHLSLYDFQVHSIKVWKFN